MNKLLFAIMPMGVLSCILLFALCFLSVHTARLVKFGWKYQRKNPPKPPEKKEEKRTPPPPSPPEPVYYIVERKRKTRASYSTPKEIRFK